MPNGSQQDLQERAEKVNEVYLNAKSKIKETGEKALSLLKGLKIKREQKRIQDLTNKLKS